MENITIEEYGDYNQPTEKKLYDILNQNRTLICSITKPHPRLTYLYLRYLQRCVKKYSAAGINNIYIVDSRANKWTVAIVKRFFPKLKVILDHKQQLVNFLKDRYQKKQTTKFLQANWVYQILFNQNSIETFYEQPTEDRLKHAKNNLMKLNYSKLTKYPDKKHILLYQLPILLKQDENLVFDMPGSVPNLYSKIIFYHELWPNKKLEEYLQIKK
jgi:hypothetical protein